MSVEYRSIADYLFKAAPNGKINCTTKQRREIMLGDNTFIWQGNLYEIKFKNLGGGIWQAYSEPYKRETQT